MKIETGDPPADGRYIIWQAIENSNFAEPKVADRLRGNWLWHNRVLGWFGPLPLRTIESFGKTWDEVFADKIKVEGGWCDRPVQKYDL